MPTTLNTYSNDTLEPREFPEFAKIDAVKFGASLTLAKGTVCGKRTSDNQHYAYNDALTDGTNVATCILRVAIKTDSNGNVFFGDSTTASETNLPFAEAPVYVGGVFDTDDLTGYDANAGTDLGAKLMPSGWIRFGF